MNFKLSEVIAFLKEINHLDSNFYIEEDQEIFGFSALNENKENTLSWIKYLNYDLSKIKSNVLICSKNGDFKKMNAIKLLPVENPRLSFIKTMNKFYEPEKQIGIMDTVKIGKNVEIGKDVYIGHYSVIGDNVKIGNNTIIRNNVSIYNNIEIGNNCIINSGVVLGADGFGYERDENNKIIKIIHIGGILIGNNVEIGSNTCIDRGTLGNTIIKDNVKIDNLCHIAHNVIINEGAFIIALSMLAGSVVIEKNAWVAPGSMIRESLKIGENSKVGMGAVVVKNVENNDIVAGVPAKSLKK
ncbi:MAG: UDP-3-O-(3-hydroxymyristoyl)glucosamine N-acyltransferase [Candidatus Sericytochromatia bacterium]